MSSKPKLSEVLKRRLNEAAGSIARAADRLNLSDNSVRVWLKRDEYPAGGLRQLLKQAGMSDDLHDTLRRYLGEPWLRVRINRLDYE